MADLEVLRTIHRLLREGQRAALANIIKTYGSTPAGVLSKMLVLEDGTAFGTVGGGLIEAQVKKDAADVFKSGALLQKKYKMSHDDIDAGMICGGSVDVLVEPLRISDSEVFKSIVSNSENGLDSVIVTAFKDGIPESKVAFARDGAGAEVAKFVSEVFSDEAELRTIVRSDSPVCIERNNVTLFADPVAGLYRLVIFGGGHVSQAVAALAKKTGFHVCVIDDRQEFVSPERFPSADMLINDKFTAVFSNLIFSPKTFIVIVTRGHSFDETTLEHAVKTSAGYIGMIGSKRKVNVVFNRLIERGTRPERLAGVFAPMGLDIGSQTVEEIAVSIVAELIKVRRCMHAEPARHLKEKISSFFTTE